MSRSDRAPRDGWGERRGVAALEFALIAPFVLILLVGTADAVLWLQTWIRLESAAAETADITSQYTSLYQSDITGTIFPIAQDIAENTQISGSGGATIISSIVNSTGQPTITWQQRTGSAAYASAFGTAGGNATLPANYVPTTGESLIAVEVFTAPHPWVFSAGLLGAIGMSTMYEYALFTPRTSQLSTLQSGNRPGS
ncbi:MAG: pilus assembly protein [Acidisphaera sp.]|nr:pilus assembly protein [Acidisphaera sp.]